MVRGYVPPKKNTQKKYSYINIDDVNRDKKTGKVTIKKGAQSYERDGKDNFKKTNQDVSGTVRQKTNNTKQLSQDFAEKERQQKEQFDKTGLTQKQIDQSTEAFNKPFQDPVGFMKDTFSKENLKETLPLALGESGAQAISSGVSWMGSRIAGMVGGRTAAKATATAIKSANEQQIAVMARSGGTSTIIKNTKNIEATKTWITKLATSLKNPKLIAGELVTLIGSYPFASFIKEESLQAIKGSYTGAMIAGNTEEAEKALEARKEILNPDLWEKIISAVPIANSIKQLKDYFSIAQTAVSIDEKLIEDMKIQQQTGETDSDKWKRINEEKAIQEKVQVDYYNSERKKLLEWEREAEKNARNEDAAFWRKEREKQAKKEAEDREAIAKFWEAYKKEAAKQAEDRRPSNLNFGLI